MEIVYSGYRHFDFRTLVTYRRIIKEEHLRSTHESKELNEILTRWKEEERRWKAFTLRFGDEMICLWEGLFPDSHNAFQMHQIMDLVSSIVPVNLLLMDFYDGGQLFRYATCDFWGLFTSIVNLPPAYREMSCRGRGGSGRGG
jgi:hypothetical protein